MNWKNRIVINPDILVGKPVIKGTRLSIELLLERLADGWSVKDLLDSYPQLTPEDVQAVFAFSLEVLQEEDYIVLSKVS